MPEMAAAILPMASFICQLDRKYLCTFGYLKQGLVVDIVLTNHSPTLHNRYSPEQAKRKEVTEGGKKDSVRHGTFSGEADWTGGGLTRVLWWDLGS